MALRYGSAKLLATGIRMSGSVSVAVQWRLFLVRIRLGHGAGTVGGGEVGVGLQFLDHVEIPCEGSVRAQEQLP